MASGGMAQYMNNEIIKKDEETNGDKYFSVINRKVFFKNKYLFLWKPGQKLSIRTQDKGLIRSEDLKEEKHKTSP